MLDYKRIYVDKNYDSVADELMTDADDLSSISWESAFWLGKCLYKVEVEENTDEKVINCLIHAMDNGLNYNDRPRMFLEASRVLARLYIRRHDYIRANNYLMDLSDRMDPVPDWVNLFYIASQILTDTVYRHTEDPVFLYKRLDSISPAAYVQRAKVYKIFLKRLHDLDTVGTNRRLNIDIFEGLRDKYIGSYLDEDNKRIAETNLPEDSETAKEVAEENVDGAAASKDDCRKDDTEARLSELEQNHKGEIEALQKRLAELESANKIKEAELADLSQKIKDREAALVRIRMGIENETKEPEEESEDTRFIKLRRNEKILIVGGLAAKVKHIIGISKLFGLREENLEIISDYDKLTNLGDRITPGKYRAIVIGPTPHSVKDNNGESSLAQRILSNPDDYPYAVRCEDENGNLKISKTSYRKALIYIARMLDVV
ncbi:MAG: hypothetical protein Q4E99_03655 [Bacillota bacterium]|nr:hypothetical protein [Bacillota bacterium]